LNECIKIANTSRIVSLISHFSRLCMILGSQFNPRMWFLLVNFVHKITNKCDTRDVFVNLLYLGTVVSAPDQARTKMAVCETIYFLK
jgi:hypothetical protein